MDTDTTKRTAEALLAAQEAQQADMDAAVRALLADPQVTILTVIALDDYGALLVPTVQAGPLVIGVLERVLASLRQREAARTARPPAVC